MRRVLVIALALGLLPALAPAAVAAGKRDPCRPTHEGRPSDDMLAALGVLHRPRTAADRPPRWILRSGSGTAMRRFIRVVDVPAANRRV